MKTLLKQYWGYDDFRPFQTETINAVLNHQDSLTLLPTGGGKSLCFQIPALCQTGMAVVISPLISLMKDQVDGLRELGIAADYLNSSLKAEEQRAIVQKVKHGEVKLLYLAPERLKTESTLQLLQSVKISFFVIDEAHCVSQWGHDFREEYSQLGIIKEKFAGVNVHAFTATATHAVQEEIIQLLKLEKPFVNWAPIDRPNLTYRIQPKQNIRQITNILEKHQHEPGIIYCLRRSDVDELSSHLNTLGYKNLPYHAGLDDELRKECQDRFSREEVDLMVATIAFGMGIDRSNIRFVIHTALPKSIEHYQQETGRAGRDGLPAFCYLFYTSKDYRTWEYLLQGSKNETVMMEKLKKLYQFCVEPQCRHQALVQYFNQAYSQGSCEACDYCLGELEPVQDPLIVGQKILSCVVRVQERFGADHVTQVLKGKLTEKIQQWNHQTLSTFGLLQDKPVSFIRSMIEQLIGQQFIKREPAYSSLSITAQGKQLLRGKAQPTLIQPVITTQKKKAVEKTKQKIKSEEWKQIDQNLFELLRQKRAELAGAKKVPAFIIFGDKTLREMAHRKPMTDQAFATVYGVGEKKHKEYATVFIEVIKQYEDASKSKFAG